MRHPLIVTSTARRLAALLWLVAGPLARPAAFGQGRIPTTADLPFTSHDGFPMRGRLTLPGGGGRHPVVIYVQNAEGMTIEMKRPLSRGGTFSYFALYADSLPAMNVGFFRYEGRGITMGDQPPRYEHIDRAVYNTSTLANKVQDIISAVRLVRRQPGVDPARVFLMGSSEGTLLAAEAAAAIPRQVRGLILYAVLPTNMRENFKYIVGDGGFLAYRQYFDTDHDGAISRAEFEADPLHYRATVFRNAPFDVFDRDGDSVFTARDMRLLSKPLLDAADSANFTVLDAWVRRAGAVAVPDHWFEDHFAQPPIWTFLSRLTMPIGIFHGELDTNTPVGGVRALEAAADSAGTGNIEFHYFDGLDHSLGVASYFTRGVLPAGHQAIFDYIRRQTHPAQ